MTRLSSKKPPRNIQRVDNDLHGDHLWVVTLQRKGAILVKRFSDGVYGGKREALKAAVKYRDSFLSLDNSSAHQIWIRTRLRKNNKSGIPGVLRYEITNNGNAEKRRTYWIAAWTDEHGATRQRKFAISRYGEEEAKELAIAEREYQLNRVCAINAANRKFHHPDQEGVWEANQAKNRNRERKRVILRKNVRYEGRRRGVQVIKATIDPDGNVKLHEPVSLTSTRRALVTIFPPGRDRPKP